MVYSEKIIDRQVGRNAQLFSQSIAEMESAEARYPYLRILVSIIEQAHPEWSNSPQKDEQIAQLIGRMSNGALGEDEIAGVVNVRDDERSAKK